MSNHVGAAARPSGISPAPVTSGLNLWLTLKEPERMGELLLRLATRQPAIDAALTGLHYVHFARFLPAPGGKALQVITEFDGEFDAYVLDFVLAIGDEFDLILSYVENGPAKSVKDDPARFLEFVRENNLGYSDDQRGNVRLFSAYPQRTVLDLIGTSGIAATVPDATPVPVPRSDVQANVLRGVAPAVAHHVGFRFGTAAGARALLAELQSGQANVPQVSSDADWQDGARPAYWLCVGFTFRGLLALGISDSDRAEFEMAHKAFVRGPDQRHAARANGDVGESRPAFWALGGPCPVDMVVSLYADNPGELARQRQALLQRCEVYGVAAVNPGWHAQALPDPDDPSRHRVHFGYVDGLAQPGLAMAGAPAATPDMQPLAAVGEFLLGDGYPNVFGGRSSLGGLSPALAENATFAALRVMEQDVAGFEALLDRCAAAHGVAREWVAAKLMGRWRDGTPVSQSPDRPLPDQGGAYVNQFDYLPSTAHPSTPDDSEGLRCPLGAHARRMNPRSSRVAGRPHSRRLLRRGLPYGPQYTPGQPDDGQPRGLVGLFFCADLERQFEFLLRQWAQGDRATAGLVGQQDPFIGAQQALPDGPPMTGQFRIPRPGIQGDLVIDMPRLVKTVGSAYLFMPGLAGLRHLAGQGAAKAASALAPGQPGPGKDDQAELPAPDPATFDPREKSFRDDPFAVYEWFRKHQPVATLRTMNSTWVFSDQHVKQVTGAPDRFRKRHSADPSPTGLLSMDEPYHGPCRDTYGALFQQVLAQVKPQFQRIVTDCYRDRCLRKGQGAAIDWVTAFAEPVAQAAFLEVFGLSAAAARGVIRQAEDILALATPAHDPALQMDIAKRQQALAATLHGLQSARVPGRLFDRFLGVGRLFDEQNNKARPPLSALEVERLVNAATLVMTGILPLQWFIALASWRLLDHGGALLQQLRTDDKISCDAVVEELLRYDMSPPMSSRHVVHDKTELGGVVLNKDQRLNLVFASANRDEAAFGPDAHLIDFKRGKGAGWAFGYGERSCLGKDMVLAVMCPVIDALRQANPVPRLADGFVPNWGTWSENALFRTMTALMVHS
jgi:cytochrome P450/deferrochelatase/peroxidase EfeB